MWFQPGSSDPDLVERARSHEMDVVDGDCIMVTSRRLAS
jgi:predicted CoA-binding protein